MGKFAFICLTTLVVVLGFEIQRIYRLDYVYPEIGYSIEQFVESLGYQLENHTVVTEDGYILEIHRLRSPNPKPGKRPIFLMHGLSCSSMSWFLSADKSLPLYLADRGYDVWLGNARGNFYSRKHLKIDPDANPEKFFKFSWHEIGAIDVPTMIDYVLKQTHHEKLYYAGHSQGSLVFHVMMNEKPEYNQKVELKIGVGPVVYTNGVKSILFRLSAAFQELLEWITPIVGFYELTPRTNYRRVLYNAYCHDGAWLQPYCDFWFGMSGGFNTLGLNSTLLPFMFTHFPAGSSIRQLFHYTQTSKANTFQHYDFGREENMLRYGHVKPPLYFLNRTTVPVAIFWSSNDWLTSERLIGRLQKELPNVVLNYKIPCEYFNHFDFFVSFTAETLFYPEFMKVIEHHNSRV